MKLGGPATLTLSAASHSSNKPPSHPAPAPPSLVELGLSSGGGLTALRSLRSLRVLKSFRVLRIVKMFRYMESIQQIARVSARAATRRLCCTARGLACTVRCHPCLQKRFAPFFWSPCEHTQRTHTMNTRPVPALQVLMSSLNSFAAIVALLVLFWLVFSIVGLHVFGGLALAPPAWPNCDTLINCGILNFHVSGEPGGARGCGQLSLPSMLDATVFASVDTCVHTQNTHTNMHPHHRRSTWRTLR